ncbi:MAG: prepilin-type N-terminal cleavage/methylation domain-containing protein [Puniceicoccales bacterium]|jgi:prepilin-type N-terminal cleavage/methylation domain-containing protein|nr:prepilin-type N-terminal cleavage/methylation domain-containing protein [Puniceicoccales bacterium]
MNTRNKRSRGFTMIEIVVVLTILLVVATALTKAVSRSGTATMIKRAQITAETVIKTAIVSYCSMKAVTQDKAGYTTALNNLLSSSNVVQDLVTSGCASKDALVDPWGKNYVIAKAASGAPAGQVVVEIKTSKNDSVAKYDLSDIFDF